jgi:hypothetical protein
VKAECDLSHKYTNQFVFIYLSIDGTVMHPYRRTHVCQ